MLVDPRRAVCIAVVGLADNHDGRLVVAARRHHAGHTVVDDLFEVFLATEQDFDVLVQTTAAVEAGVDDDAVAKIVLPEDLRIHVAVTGITHAADMDITQTTFRKFLHRFLVVLYPAMIKQLVHRAMADGFHGLFPGLATVFQRHKHRLSSLVVEQRIIVHGFRNLHAVNLLDDATCLYLRAFLVERRAFYHLGDFQAITTVIKVEQHAKLCRGIATTICGTIARSRVRHVQLAQNFAQHLAEVVVVVDVRQK